MAGGYGNSHEFHFFCCVIIRYLPSLTITTNGAKVRIEKKGIALLVHSPQTENNQTTSITAFFSSQQAGL